MNADQKHVEAIRVVTVHDLAAEYLANDWLFHSPSGLSPMERRSAHDWAQRFRTVGYFDFESILRADAEGRLAFSTRLTFEDTRPLRSIKLYRYCVAGGERRMAWAEDAAYARMYGNEEWCYQPSSALIYTVEAPPESILAILRGNLHTEFVLDTTNLTITRENNYS